MKNLLTFVIKRSLNMSFEKKIIENLEFIDECKKYTKWYNIAANRCYYSAYQKVKCYLIKIDFDYEGYLSKNGLNDQKVFSHGTVMHALSCYILENKKSNNKNTSEIIAWDDLYQKRKIADYNEKLITKNEFKILTEELNKIIRLIDSLED